MAKEKNKGGRPRKYQTIEQLQAAIDDYFDNACGYTQIKDLDGNVIYDKKGNAMIRYVPPTVTGLALHLGFTTRKSLIENEGYSDAFLNAIKKAKLRIENNTVEMASTGALKETFSIFNLKVNYNWEDKKIIEQTSDIMLKSNLNLSKLSDEELKELEEITNKATD